MLFTPLQLGGKRLKNRIAFPAVLSIYAQQNRVTQRLIDYYAARAVGGAAMVITEGLAIHPSSVPQPGRSFRPLRPKSTKTGISPSRKMMFEGLRSRCASPAPCIASSAAKIPSR